MRIEAARATATLLGQVKANVYGTPADVARMTETFMRGMGVSTAVEGFLEGAEPDDRRRRRRRRPRHSWGSCSGRWSSA